MRRYPLVYYFHARQNYRSLPYMLWFIGAAASALRWGPPSGDPAAADPWLPGLLDGYEEALAYVETTFMTTPPEAAAEPAGRAAFLEARAHGRSEEQGISDFLELERFIASLTKRGPSPDGEDAYDRYLQWWKFTATRRAFVRAINRDFGMDPDAASRPGHAGL